MHQFECVAHRTPKPSATESFTISCIAARWERRCGSSHLVETRRLSTAHANVGAHSRQLPGKHQPTLRREFEDVAFRLDDARAAKSRPGMKCIDIILPETFLALPRNRLREAALEPNSSCQLIVGAPPVMPLPRSLRHWSRVSATPTRAFFGSQPRRAHVPPKGK